MNAYRSTTIIGAALWLYVAIRLFTYLHSEPLDAAIVAGTFIGCFLLTVAAFILTVVWKDNSPKSE